MKKFRIFFAALTVSLLLHLHKILPGRKINVLRAYQSPSPGDRMLFNGIVPNIGKLMLDCGTYLLHSTKSSALPNININGYMQWVRWAKQQKQPVHFYPNFDRNFTLYGFQDNWLSMQTMESQGLHPFPVIHDFHNKEIPFYLNRGHKFMALGSIMKKGSKKKLRTKDDIEHALLRIPTSEVDVHLFGASSYNMIASLALAPYSLYSCDSSSWVQNSNRGHFLYWNPYKAGENKTEQIYFLDKIGDSFREDRMYWEYHPNRYELEEYIASLGFTYMDLIGHPADANHHRQLLNVIYYLTIEDVINKKRQLST